MNKIITPKGMGKTYQLLHISSRTKYYIVCRDTKECHRLELEAINLNLDIPLPISYREFKNGDFYSKGIKGFLIDDADALLEYIADGVPVHTITMTNG